MKKLFYLITINCILLTVRMDSFGVNCFGQSITWQRLFDGPGHIYDKPYDNCISTSNSIFVIGQSGSYGLLIRLNAYGDTIWTKKQGGLNCVSTGDGGCVITGVKGGYPNTDSLFIMKIDSNSNTLWKRTYPGYLYTFDLQFLPDRSFIACGNDFVGEVVKFDSSGNLEWRKSYYGIGYNLLSSIDFTYDNGYITCGSEYNFGKAIVIKLNSSGDTIWYKRFELNIGSFIHKHRGSYIFAGSILDTLYQKGRVYFTKIDGNGNILYTHVLSTLLPSYKNEDFRDMKIINDNKLVFASFIQVPSNDTISVKLYTTDTLGNQISEHTVSTTHNYYDLTNLLPLSNGDIFASGEAETYNTNWQDFYFIRADSLLNFPPLGIKQINFEVPSSFELYQNYPNPFNGNTIIKFAITKTSIVQIIVYDILGKEVMRLVDKSLKAGTYEVSFNSNELASGVYFYTLQAGSFKETKKMILSK